MTFKRRLKFSQSQVNALVKSGRIEIQQGGYLGDNLHHDKLVIFDPRSLKGAFETKPRILSKRDPPSPNGKKYDGSALVDKESRSLYSAYRFKNWRLDKV